MIQWRGIVSREDLNFRFPGKIVAGVLVVPIVSDLPAGVTLGEGELLLINLFSCVYPVMHPAEYCVAGEGRESISQD